MRVAHGCSGCQAPAAPELVIQEGATTHSPARAPANAGKVRRPVTADWHESTAGKQEHDRPGGATTCVAESSPLALSASTVAPRAAITERDQGARRSRDSPRAALSSLALSAGEEPSAKPSANPVKINTAATAHQDEGAVSRTVFTDRVPWA